MKNTIMNWLESNKEELKGIANELYWYNGSLEHLYFIPMEDLDEYLYGFSPTDIANKIHYGNFNPNHEYFKFNVYANLVSYDNYEMQDELEYWIDEIADVIIDNWEYVELPKGLEELLQEMDKEVEEF